MGTATKASKDIQHRVVGKGATPMEALFEPWELIDWASINKTIATGKTVHIDHASVAHDERHWIGCALRELGRQNVHVTLCHIRLDDTPSQGLWIIPRSALGGVLLETFERVYE